MLIKFQVFVLHLLYRVPWAQKWHLLFNPRAPSFAWWYFVIIITVTGALPLQKTSNAKSVPTPLRHHTAHCAAKPPQNTLPSGGSFYLSDAIISSNNANGQNAIRLNTFRHGDAFMWMRTESSVVQLIAFRLYSVKPLPEPMMTYHRLNSEEETSVKFNQCTVTQSTILYGDLLLFPFMAIHTTLF